MQTQPPAPVIQYGAGAGAKSTGMHIVSSHETIWDIAQRYRLSVADIVHINRLHPPFLLTEGQNIKLPSPRTYTARSGDTLYSVSRLYDVATTELVRLNTLRAPYIIVPGQVLRLPPPPEPRPGPALPKAQTVFSIATANNPTEAPAPPGLKPPVRYAQSHTIGVHFQALQKGAPAVSAAPPGAIEKEPLPYPSGMSASVPVYQGRNIISADTPQRSGSLFAWPLKGKILSAYGTKANGQHNDGINIAAPRGAAVKAAENGVVVYAGNQLKGFGNLVLVRHADKWMTAYAHMDSLSVAKGQAVKKGERLGAAGSTGGVSGPQLHFEVRRGTEALNPVAFLEKI